MKRTFRRGIGSAWLITTMLTACGYQFAGTGDRLPEDVLTVELGPMTNATREVAFDRAFLEALEDEIALRGRLEVVPAETGDAVLSGSVRDYVSRPISFSGRDEVLEYEASVGVDLELRRRRDGAVLWRTTNLRGRQLYSAVPGVVVTSSSRFQQQTVNAGDLPQFTDIQLAESQRREANETMLEELSRDVYNQMMEDF